MKTFINTFLLLVSISIFAQKYENKLDSLIPAISSKLIKKGITEFFFLSDNCRIELSGENIDTGEITEMPYNEFKVYVFIKNGNKISVQKFDNYNPRNKLKAYNPTILNNFKGFDIINKYSKKIKLEKVKNYGMYSNGKKALIDFAVNCFTKFNFFQKSNTFQNEFFIMDIEKSTNSNVENENINFKYNSRLKLIKLFRLCEIEIENMENLTK